MTETAQDRPSAVPRLPGGRAGPGEEDAIRSEIRGEQLRLLFKAANYKNYENLPQETEALGAVFLPKTPDNFQHFLISRQPAEPLN